jgi:hypothetical protein
MKENAKLWIRTEENGLWTHTIRRENVIKWIYQKRWLRMWTGFIWLRMGINGGVL